MESVGEGGECWLELHWQPDRLVVRCCDGVCALVCTFVCGGVRVRLYGSVGLWEWYQCHSQLISGYLEDVATLICHHHRHICGFGITTGLLFQQSHSLLVELLCPVASERSFHGWLCGSRDMRLHDYSVVWFYWCYILYLKGDTLTWEEPQNERKITRSWKHSIRHPAHARVPYKVIW